MSAINGVPEGQRALTHDEVRAELQRLKLGKNCPSERIASLFSARLPFEGRDLLHEAVCRALTSRQCREAITVGQFLNGIMRSIASTAKRAADARDAQEVFMPKEEVAERLGLGGYHVNSAEQELENERVRESLAEKIAQLAVKSERHARLIDGIGHNLRGQQLAEFVDVTQEELATLRRSLKREAQRIWPEVVGIIASTDYK